MNLPTALCYLPAVEYKSFNPFRHSSYKTPLNQATRRGESYAHISIGDHRRPRGAFFHDGCGYGPGPDG
jgi:hypothetical protein